ncbi:beta-hydroxylase [Planctomycetales bacterium]|nr:beta-hydroxylase [Planctomycetales bacterium]
MRLDETRRQELRRFFLSQQMPDGSFCGRGQRGDLYYTSFALRGLFLLGGLGPNLAENVSRYLQTFELNKLNPADLTSWLIAKSLLYPIQDTTFSETEICSALNRWNDFRRDGGYATSRNTNHASVYTTFLAAVSFELLGCGDKIDAISYDSVLKHQRGDGGFSELTILKHSGTNPTAAAIALLTMKEISVPNREQTANFLKQRQLISGGFQAHERIPVADLLSTFSAITALRDLDAPTEQTPQSLQNYLRSLRSPTGGYFGVVGDTVADAEYTFYGMTLEDCDN